MSHEQPSVIMVSPSIEDPGGIASVVRSYVESELPGMLELRLIETVRGTGPARHLRGVAGVLRAGWFAARDPRAIVHVHMSFGGSFWRKAAVLLAARAFGRRSILHLHGSRFHTWVEKRWLRRQTARLVFGLPEMVLVLSNSWAERVARFSGRNDAVVLENPVHVPEEITAGRGSGLVVFLGRVGERKGVEELIRAAALLQREGLAVQWVIAGDGDIEWARALVEQEGLSDVVDVPGWVDRSRVEALLKQAAVFCLPSTDEGLPIALLEAMAYGLACVVTPVGGIPELVRDGVNGVLVEPRDPVSLASGLRRVLGDDEFAASIGDHARADVAASYSVETVAQRLAAMYREVSAAADRAGGDRS